MYSRDENYEPVETPGIAVALWPQSVKHGWYDNVSGTFMVLRPISHDEPPRAWIAKDRSIPIWARDACFNKNKEKIKELFGLESLEYDPEIKKITMESAIFHGESRISSHRHIIKPSERDQILEELYTAISKDLQIEFESWQEFFDTE